MRIYGLYKIQKANKMKYKGKIVFINMAKGFGGGEFYTEQLIRHLEGYQCYFFGKSSAKLATHLKETIPHIRILNFLGLLKLVFCEPKVLIHALDGRGAHFAGIIKRIFKQPIMITRQVDFPFKRESSKTAYNNADMLIGVSQKITRYLTTLNSNAHTIYGCLKTLEENPEFERKYFSDKVRHLKIAHIGNFQQVKNFPLTIALAKQNPDVSFYLVGSGELELELKQQAALLPNVIFIPFTPYIGSVLKNMDLVIIPSHSEGLGMTILEAYQYYKPVIAHSVGGIPEIVEHNKTGFLISENKIENYQVYLDKLKSEPKLLKDFAEYIQQYILEQDFSAVRMAREYSKKYDEIMLVKS